jgi:hypothetical protein
MCGATINADICEKNGRVASNSAGSLVLKLSMYPRLEDVVTFSYENQELR